MTKRYRIAVIPGDGVGTEVIPEAMKALEVAAHNGGGLDFEFEVFPWGCEFYQATGTMMPTEGIAVLRTFDHILLGAVGWPTVPDHVSLWGLLLPIRREFQQYVNARPTKLLKGARSPLARTERGFEFLVVRENSEGEYSRLGGRLHDGTPNELAAQVTVFTRAGTERVLRYAFERAAASRGLLVGATKSNGIEHVMPYWDEVFRRLAVDYPTVKATLMHADALAAAMILEPESFDVIVASNLLGDILSEIGAAIQGSIGIAASANLNPEGSAPCMFEPVHGSAPDIAGRGAANPIGAIWSAQMLLEHIGRRDLAAQLLRAIEASIQAGDVTADLGGSLGTTQASAAIMERFRALEPGEGVAAS